MWFNRYRGEHLCCLDDGTLNYMQNVLASLPHWKSFVSQWVLNLSGPLLQTLTLSAPSSLVQGSWWISSIQVLLVLPCHMNHTQVMLTQKTLHARTHTSPRYDDGLAIMQDCGITMRSRTSELFLLMFVSPQWHSFTSCCLWKCGQNRHTSFCCLWQGSETQLNQEN